MKISPVSPVPESWVQIFQMSWLVSTALRAAGSCKKSGSKSPCPGQALLACRCVEQWGQPSTPTTTKEWRLDSQISSHTPLAEMFAASNFLGEQGGADALQVLHVFTVRR